MRLLEVKQPNIIVVYGGGFQPFHEGHASSYREAKAAFPGAYFFVAASNVTSERPFEFKEKQFLAKQAGVVDPFIQVGTMSYVNDNGRKVTSTPLNPLEVLQKFNPEKDVLIIVRSERDPMKTTDVSYYQPWQGIQGAEPFSKHAYIFVTKKHDFSIAGNPVYSGSQVRELYSGADDKTKLSILQDLYPQSRQLEKIKQIFDKRLAVAEGVVESLEHFNGIEISMEKENDEIMVTAMMSGGRELGHVLFIIDGEYLMPQDLEVDERYQGQGIAATMYDYVKSKGYKIRRSGQQTDAGAGFWDKHKPGKNVWEQDIDEARRNPEQNPKPESGMIELASIAKTIKDPENWAISMTSEPKLGINPQVGISEDTPKGIYFYPLNYALDKTRYGKLPWGDNYPYIQLFQYDRSGEMTKETQVDPARLKQALLQYCPEEVIQSAIDEPEYDGTPYWTIYDCLSRLGQSDETNIVRWNKVLRDLGFTSVFDNGTGWIAYNEPTQGVVLDPRVIKQHKTITNKQKSKLVTPAVIERAIFETMDMELASNRAWQAYDPDGSKLRAAAKEYAKKPEFKQWFGKPGSEEIFDKAASWGRYGARQLSQESWEWYQAQRATKEGVDEASLATMRDYFAGDENARDPYEITKQRLHFAKDKTAGQATHKKEFRSKWEYEQWLKQNKLKQISDSEEYDLEEEAANLLEYLRKIHKRWAIVSKREGRPLVYFKGDGKPSKDWVEKQERRINYFKHKK